MPEFGTNGMHERHKGAARDTPGKAINISTIVPKKHVAKIESQCYRYVTAQLPYRYGAWQNSIVDSTLWVLRMVFWIIVVNNDEFERQKRKIATTPGCVAGWCDDT